MPRTLKLMCLSGKISEKLRREKAAMVIISSIARLIKQGVAAADAELKKRVLANFSGVSASRFDGD
jgi:hypothetical protein